MFHTENINIWWDLSIQAMEANGNSNFGYSSLIDFITTVTILPQHFLISYVNVKNKIFKPRLLKCFAFYFHCLSNWANDLRRHIVASKAFWLKECSLVLDWSKRKALDTLLIIPQPKSRPIMFNLTFNVLQTLI